MTRSIQYHAEVGTAKVETIIQEQGSQHLISRLGAVEMLSVFAGKVRTGSILLADFEILRKRFLTELNNRVFQVVRMTGLYYKEAEGLVRRHGPTQSSD